MKLKLVREVFGDKATIGKLYVNKDFECYTLEDKVRDTEKVFGETAIPYGVYQVILSMSPRFKRVLPLLVAVPGFEGVRIHPGNKPEDTEGCLLVGRKVSPDNQTILESKLAFDALFAKLQTATKEKITIEITKAP